MNTDTPDNEYGTDAEHATRRQGLKATLSALQQLQAQEEADGHAQRMRQYRMDDDDEGFTAFMTPLKIDEQDTIGKHLDGMVSLLSNRSYASQTNRKAPDWEAEHERHPLRKAAHTYGRAAGAALLHFAGKLNHALNHEPRARLAHFLHGAANQIHPGPEPKTRAARK